MSPLYNRIPNLTSIRLYRILLRELQFLPSRSFLLQQPINPQDYGRACLFRQASLEEDTNNDKGINGAMKNICNFFSRWLLNDGSINNSKEEHILQWYKETVGQDVGSQDDNSGMCLWTSRCALLSTFRHSFRSASDLSNTERHQFAMKAIQTLKGVTMMLERSSTSTKDGLRVVATSSCIGKAASATSQQETKNRFAYRIRVENSSNNDKTVQLLGRSWVILEENKDGTNQTDPVIVNAPTTGAVGHLPVLEPGYVFEYMSGCELSTDKGEMKGHFHMAVVPPLTASAMVGDHIDTIQESEKFELPVDPFPLLVK
mmetsp:Transcript_9356/g.10676  ORF Transcript_9356/g.10676 Transcript_9356/m.10676 type:complete len:316 (-) Transcript_9356:282-1229(-)